MSNQNNNSFRKQLLSQEKTNPRLQKTFHLEAKKMYTEKLKKGQRFAHILVSFLIAFFTLFFWAMAKMFEELQIKHELNYAEPLRLASIWAMFLSMVLILLCLWPAIRGKIGLRFYPKVIRFVFWILILAVVLMLFATFNFLNHVPNSDGLTMDVEFSGILTMIAMVVVMGSYMLLSGRIDRGDMKNKAKSLELEYRLTELEEKLNHADKTP